MGGIGVLVTDFVWYFLPGPFESDKQFQVFALAWVLGLIFVLIAYKQRERRLTLAYWGTIFLVVDFCLVFSLPSI